MPHDPQKLLEDMDRACAFLLQMTRGRSLDDYRADEILRTVVERKFEIIGEALNRLIKADATVAGRIPEHRQIISFRNLLIHGYDVIDDQVVWEIVEKDLPALKQTIAILRALPPNS